MTTYVAPSYNSEAFNCPSCGAYAHQIWSAGFSGQGSVKSIIPNTGFGYCAKCRQYSFWYKERMIHPSGGNTPLPHPDLPQEIKEDYEEARSVFSKSPRSCAALLRLTIQKLTNMILGENKKKNLSDNIQLLVKAGLQSDIHKALDIVRVIGNNAVHPGQIDVDSMETASKLFRLVNLIVQQVITEPKEIRALYGSLPEEDRKNIEKRDGAKPSDRQGKSHK